MAGRVGPVNPPDRACDPARVRERALQRALAGTRDREDFALLVVSVASRTRARRFAGWICGNFSVDFRNSRVFGKFFGNFFGVSWQFFGVFL